MSGIRFGCQFYTWQMSGDRYVGRLPHILGVVRAAGGFAGIEPETGMLGSYYQDPLALRDLLAQHGLVLGALTLVCAWAGPSESEEEKREAERVFAYLKAFPGTHLMLCHAAGPDRSNLRQRQKNALACINAVGARAAEQAIVSSFHPNSPPGSVFRVAEDYSVLFDGLDPRVVGYAPDSGHIARGGMNVVRTFETYRPLIRHVHFKDMAASGEWVGMGEGLIDFPRIVAMLRDTGYAGWIMVEEESLGAEADPDVVTLHNGRYLRQSLLPVLA